MKLGFIGTGNMGGALLTAFAKTVDPSDIGISNHTVEISQTVASRVGCVVSNNVEIAEQAEYIFLGVKPQRMAEMLAGIQEALRERTTPFVLVSMAAGPSLADIASMAGGHYPVIRIMPNTPVAIGAGTILICHNELVSEQTAEQFMALGAQTGGFVPTEEALFDAACAVSGCGPAFVYQFAEALAQGGVRCGLDYDTALTLAAQTLQGAAGLILAGEKTPDQLTDAVCSPGGCTIEGVRSLQREGLSDVTQNAVIAAYTRAVEMGKE